MRPHSTTLCGRCRFLPVPFWDKQSQGAGLPPDVASRCPPYRFMIHWQIAELEYYVAEEYWGKGIMTEAVKQICEYVFDKSDIIRIYAEPFAYNIASCRVNSLRKTIER